MNPADSKSIKKEIDVISIETMSPVLLSLNQWQKNYISELLAQFKNQWRIFEWYSARPSEYPQQDPKSWWRYIFS